MVHSEKKRTETMRHLLLLLLLFSMPSLAANQWLCIGEYGSKAPVNGSEVLEHSSFTNSNKFLVSEDGLKHFGEDYYLFDKCTLDEGVPRRCESSMGDLGIFHMPLAQTFTLMYILIPDLTKDRFEFWIITGHCSKL